MGRGGLVAAFLLAEGLYTWRVVNRYHRPPVPGDILGITVLFVALGFAAEYRPALPFVTAVAWGLDVAAFLQLFPQGLGAEISKAQTAEQNAAGDNGANQNGGPPGLGHLGKG